jgi:hypothetical protein
LAYDRVQKPEFAPFCTTNWFDNLMATEKRFLTYNILALIFALWFLLAGWAWIYSLNVFFVFPFAIAGFFLWRIGREAENKLLNKIVGWMLWAGLVSSLGFLVAQLFRK